MLRLETEQLLGDGIGNGARASAVGTGFGQQRLEAAVSVSFKPVADGFGGEAGSLGTGDGVVALRKLGDAGVQALGGGREVDEFGDNAISEQGDVVGVLGLGIFHSGPPLRVGRCCRDGGKLPRISGWVSPRFVLVGAQRSNRVGAPGTESEWRGERAQMCAGEGAQLHEHRFGVEMPAKRAQRRLAARQALRHQSAHRRERPVHGLNAPSGPADDTRQVDLRTQVLDRGLETRRLLHRHDNRLDIAQRAR